jgi:ribosome-binding protein aMBF1 (putative translation factor)
MTRCAICGTVLSEEDPIREMLTGSELDVCEECNGKLSAVKEAAEEQDDEKYESACAALMEDERKGRSEAANKLLDTYCRRCRNPEEAVTEDQANYAEKEEPNSFIQQIQESLEEEELENREIDKEIKKTNIQLVTRLVGIILFVGGTVLSIILGFLYRHMTVDYTNMGISMEYNYAIAVFGSLAFFLCGLMVVFIGEYFHHQNIRTQMMEKLYDKAYDKLYE